jgi:ubiquinone/menaquinone biosynthesis C-methylase UbiE
MIESNREDVLIEVKKFYEKTPFPNYSEFYDVATLIDKARKSIFIKSLNDEIPFGAKILEAGCGTGQLSNYLSVGHGMVVGTDISMNSLVLAQDFKENFGLSRAHFLQMNIFRPCFRAESFDVVVSNGVLHHTSDPKEGLRILATLTRKSGYLVIGLYHRFGRLMTDLRRLIYQYYSGRLTFLDHRLSRLNEKQRRAWFLDQYRNPHESKHTIKEVCGWLEEFDLVFRKSIPGNYFGSLTDGGTSLFKKNRMGGTYESTLVELSFAFRRSQIQEGGFFVVIAQKT